MSKSTALKNLLVTLTRDARRMGLTDAAWADRADLRKESLSRLRRRDTCDFATLHALAEAVGMRVDVRPAQNVGLSPDGHFPAKVNRDLEERLADLCARGETDPDRWTELGPPFFMAGLAVMLAGAPGLNGKPAHPIAFSFCCVNTSNTVHLMSCSGKYIFLCLLTDYLRQVQLCLGHPPVLIKALWTQRTERIFHVFIALFVE